MAAINLRQLLHERPQWAVGIVAIIAAAAWLFQRSRTAPSLPVIPDQGFYSTDGGKTVFADSLTRIPPFDHDGHPAVRAHVYTCDNGSHRWVQYLEKLSDESIRAAARAGADAPVARSGALVQKAGADGWVSERDPGARQIMDPQCPEGGGVPTEVFP